MAILKPFDVEDTFVIDAGRIIVGILGSSIEPPAKGQKLRVIAPDGTKLDVEVEGYGDFTKCFSET